MRLDKSTFYFIVERFVNDGVGKDLIAESFSRAFGFESNPQMKKRIVRWDENKLFFHKISERRFFQKKFGHVPSIEEIASFYKVNSEELMSVLKEKALEGEIQPIGRWSKGEEIWHGYTIDIDGMIELDKVFGGEPSQGASYWSL